MRRTATRCGTHALDGDEHPGGKRHAALEADDYETLAQGLGSASRAGCIRRCRRNRWQSSSVGQGQPRKFRSLHQPVRLALLGSSTTSVSDSTYARAVQGSAPRSPTCWRPGAPRILPTADDARAFESGKLSAIAVTTKSARATAADSEMAELGIRNSHHDQFGCSRQKPRPGLARQHRGAVASACDPEYRAKIERRFASCDAKSKPSHAASQPRAAAGPNGARHGFRANDDAPGRRETFSIPQTATHHENCTMLWFAAIQSSAHRHPRLRNPRRRPAHRRSVAPEELPIVPPGWWPRGPEGQAADDHRRR